MDDSKRNKRSFFQTDDLKEEPLSTDAIPQEQMTIDCPTHHLPLQVQTEQRQIGDKTVLVRFAVCKCRVPDNERYGHRIWEQIPKVETKE